MTKLQDIQKVFCIRPWHESSMATTGEATICHAQMRGPEKGFPKSNGQTMGLETHTVDEIMNSQLHRDIRLAQFQGRWHENCDNCRIKESTDTEDKFRVVPSISEIQDCFKNMLPDGSMRKIEVTRIDVRFSNLCNAACLQCGAVASNKWYDDHYGFFGTEYGHRSASTWTLAPDEHGRPRPTAPRDNAKLDNFWQMCEDHLDTIDTIILLGGEPLIMPEHERLLDFFIQKDRAKNIRLFYNTNLSVINHKILSRWEHYKIVDLSLSIDDVSNRYDLIRYGVTWDKLCANIHTVRDIGNIRTSISPCYMIPNMLSMTDIDRWADAEGIRMNLKFVHEPFYMTVNSLPKEARLELININKQAGTKMSLEAADWIEKQIDQPSDPAACDQFVRFMDYLDKSRKQDWRATLVETADFLKRYDIG